jgi:formylglycine-generating enzyme required for sulfatase activity/Fe-S cluster biogenesis protein NfuA
MGSETGGEFERPVHEVFVDAYWIDETLVTNGEFAEFVEATGHVTEAERAGAAWGYREGRYRAVAGLSWRGYAAPDRVDHPVLLISWEDASAYARWAGKCLPTEAQWERAARAGREQQAYPWGEEEPDGTQCNFARDPAEIPPTTPVRAFPTNDFGLYDLVGNVWQWCVNWYQPDSYSVDSSMSSAGSDGTHRARRGGAWNVIQPFRLRTANRGALDPHATAPNVGFRCVCPIAEVSAMTAEDRSAEVDRVLNSLRPAMEADGGGVEFVSAEEGVVRVRLSGTCLACPSVSLTLREGVERTLRRELPWVTSLERVP